MTDVWHVILDGDVVRQVASIEGEDVEGKTVIETTRCGNLRYETIDSDGTWHDRIDVLRVDAIAKIDQEREGAQQALMTAGSAKAMVYAQKSREADRYLSLDAPAFAALSGSQRWARFPAAMAETEQTGAALGTVLDGIVEAASYTNTILYRIDAMAVAAKQAVRAAETRAEIDAAATIVWPEGEAE